MKFLDKQRLLQIILTSTCFLILEIVCTHILFSSWWEKRWKCCYL